MKITYQRKLTLSFLVIFIIFTAGIIFFYRQTATTYKTEALEERLDSYAQIVHEYLSVNGTDGYEATDSLMEVLPDELRVTVISFDGRVLYDNTIIDLSELDNHKDRPEIEGARNNGYGTFVRTSSTNSLPYLYYAKYFGSEYVRVALPYDLKVRSFLKPDNAFLYFILALLLVGVGFIRYVSGRFGRSIRELRDFSVSTGTGSPDIKAPRFPKDELGEIGDQIVKDYNRLKENEMKLAQEREKLLQHVQSSEEGICFFDRDHTVAFYNGLFLQYLNTISRNSVVRLSDLMQDPVFAPVLDFMKERCDDNFYETHINRQGKDFLLRVNIFDDDSFEIVLNDVTSQEKTRKLKQEMTGNIAHELRTPVTSIRGFLETVLENDLDPQRQRDFLEKAYNQTRNLSDLISDMSLLTKIEQGPESFQFKSVAPQAVMAKVAEDMEEVLKSADIMIENHLPVDLYVKGNDTLVYSIFRNLTENVVQHAGNGVKIIVTEVERKDGMVYFSFTDTGKGVSDESHLNRLFERFFRVSEGRTRESGGSGLGLSIVRNSVIFHGGRIVARNSESGGLEFLFSLPIS